MVDNRLRLAVGIMGNATSLLLFAAPILTFTRVVRKRSTEEFSPVPYIISFFNCLIYTWYGLPVVSYRWENFPLVTINGLGILLEFSFIFIYFWLSTAKGKMKVAATLIPVIIFFIIIAAISGFVFHDHHHRKLFVGSIGLIAAVAMYGSPLVVVAQVIKTRSVEFMPFYLSFFSFLASTIWMIYGLLSHDFFLSSPNMVGCPLGMLQLVVYFKYTKKGGVTEEPNKWDLERNCEKNKQPQPFLFILPPNVLKCLHFCDREIKAPLGMAINVNEPKWDVVGKRKSELDTSRMLIMLMKKEARLLCL